MRTSRNSLLAAAALLAGCGGHGGSASPSARTAKVAFTVAWPAKTGRYIPNAAAYIRVVVTDPSSTPANAVVGTLEFLRSDVAAGGGTSTKSFTTPPLVKEGDYAVTADAYANSHPLSESPITTENPLSHGVQTLTVVAGATANSNVVLASQLTQFSVALTDLIEGTGGSYTLDGTAAGTVPLTATGIYSATVEGQHDASHDLILFPVGSSQTTLGATAFDVLSPTGAGATLTATLVANADTPATGTLSVSFVDGVVSFAPTRPTTLTALNPVVAAPVALSLDGAPALASSKTDSYAIVHTAANGYLLVSLADVTATTALAGTAPYALSATTDERVYGVVGASSVTRSGGGTAYDLGTSSHLVALAPFRIAGATAGGMDNYALSSDSATGGVLSLSKLDNATGVVTATPGPSVSVTPSGFAVGYDPATRKVAFYTIDRADLRRYTLQGTAYALDSTFPAAGVSVSPVAIAADGNLVGVLSANGTLTLLNVEGKVLETQTGFVTLATGQTAVGLSMAGGQGAVSYGDGTAYSIAKFTY